MKRGAWYVLPWKPRHVLLTEIYGDFESSSGAHDSTFSVGLASWPLGRDSCSAKWIKLQSSTMGRRRGRRNSRRGQPDFKVTILFPSRLWNRKARAQGHLQGHLLGAVTKIWNTEAPERKRQWINWWSQMRRVLGDTSKRSNYWIYLRKQARIFRKKRAMVGKTDSLKSEFSTTANGVIWSWWWTQSRSHRS